MIYQNSRFGRAVGRWGLIAASIAALVAPAAAADLPVKAPTPAAPTWDGVYLGAAIGWEKTDTNWNTTCLTTSGQCPDSPANGGPFFTDGSSPFNFSTSGARYGGYFGVNWQVLPAWVVGVEADAAWMNQSSRVAGLIGCTTFCVPAFGPGSPVGDSTSVGTNWDASMRARAGYLVTPNALVYGTAGLALKESTASMSCDAATSPWCLFNEGQSQVSRVQTGWTAGGGIEYRAWGNWFVRGEYRYSGYQSWSPTFFQGTADEVHATLSTHSQTAIFGVHYLFGGTPVINK
jgi:outer membrane immunogenic protein